jgi:hypothetical protein
MVRGRTSFESCNPSAGLLRSRRDGLGTLPMPHAHPIEDARIKRPWYVRAVLLGVALLALAACLIVSPYVLLVVGMSFDTPGASWNWMHIPVLGLPTALAACAGAASWGAISSKLRMLWIAALLLVIDLATLTIMWITASG